MVNILSYAKRKQCIIFLLIVIASISLLLQTISITWFRLRMNGLEKSLKQITPSWKREQTFSEKLSAITNCYDSSLVQKIEQHGDFWVLYNYVKAEEEHRCFETITYTTQGDYTFLDNLIPIVRRWRGPVSVALHAPGTDFVPTLESIAYLRNCDEEKELFKRYVSFHIVFDTAHLPRNQNSKPFDVPVSQIYEDSYNCSNGAPYANVTYKDLYKIKAKISYPINVARNVAREGAQTHFVLASDIELYPSTSIIHQFLNMIIKKPELLQSETPVIFVLPVFEVVADESPPENKKVLQKMYKEKKLFSFHHHICDMCHAIPNLDEWLNLTASNELNVFIKTKRQGKQIRWEAVYIGTNQDPLFDERLDWEKHGNKMAQAYILCLLDYDYLVLDNAFLVHRPGIKKKMVNAEVIPRTAKYINKVLGTQLNTLYGGRKGCRA